MRNLLFFIAFISILSLTSCIATDVPVMTTSVKVMPYDWHHPLPPLAPRRPNYVCPPPRNPYKPIWQQRPNVRPRQDGFRNMNRKPIDRPRNIISPRNKNFGSRR